MMEFAASFPRQAEASLSDLKASISRFLPGNRKLSDSDAWIEVTDKDEAGRIFYVIRTSSEIEEAIAAQKKKLESEIWESLKPSMPRVLSAYEAGMSPVCDGSEDWLICVKDEWNAGQEDVLRAPYRQCEKILALRF